MPVTVLSLGPTYNITQNVVYALSGAPCYVKAGALLERSTLEAGPFTSWPNSNNLVYNFRGGFVRCPSGNTTITPTKIKMKQMKQSAYKAIRDGASNLWQLNELSGTTAVDVIGGANGTISGGVTLNGESGMVFNGTNGQILSSNLIPIPVVATVEAWVKTAYAGLQPFLGIPATSAWGMDQGKALFYNTGPMYIGSRVINDNQWHHYASVVNSTTCLIYIDGVLDLTVGINRPSQDLGAAQIGYISWSPIFWNGSIDEVAIYPRALTPAEISDHYRAR